MHDDDVYVCVGFSFCAVFFSKKEQKSCSNYYSNNGYVLHVFYNKKKEKRVKQKKRKTRRRLLFLSTSIFDALRVCVCDTICHINLNRCCYYRVNGVVYPVPLLFTIFFSVFFSLQIFNVYFNLSPSFEDDNILSYYILIEKLMTHIHKLLSIFRITNIL